MSELIINAPMQLRESTVPKYERYLALLTAEGIRKIEEDKTGVEQARIDVWNSVSAKVDAEIAEDNRDTQLSNQLERRYGFLQGLGVSVEERISLLDDSPEYAEVVQHEIKVGIQNGTFSLSEESMNTCCSCGNCISLAESPAESCFGCGSSEIAIQDQQVLLLHFGTEDIESMNATQLFPSKGISPQRVTNDLHPTFLASKQRQSGVSLDQFGLDGFVLDPKIGLGMVGAVLESLGHGTLTRYVQGRDSLPYSLPFLGVFSPKVQQILLNSMVPKKMFTDIDDRWSHFYKHVLPLLSINTKERIQNNQVRSWSKMASGTKARLDTLDQVSLTEGTAQIQEELTSIWSNILEYRVELAYNKFTLLVKKVRSGKLCISSSEQTQLLSLANTFIYYE